MEEQGMMAVVKQLEGAGLAVTLVDGHRRFTLVPKAVAPALHSRDKHLGTIEASAATITSKNNIYQHNVGIEAIDGRYTSTYQMAHCSVKPTSPPFEVTEFPPQRPNGCLPGRDNFLVGGTGSGETNTNFAIKKSPTGNGYPSTPRISRETDTFVSSLRKYPSTSPDRSSEIIEKLVNYLPEKNSFRKSRLRPQQYNTRPSPVFYNADHTYRPSRRPSGEPDLYPRMRSSGESPTKENGSTAQEFCPIMECEEPPRDWQKHSIGCNFVNTECQAAVRMVSKEVSTDSRPEPSRRTIALPLSPSQSTTKTEDKEDLGVNWDEYTNELAEQIDEWLYNLNLSLTPDMELIEAVVYDMADEIVERFKYSKLKLSNQGTESAELEELKYQIFKWITKVVEDGITEVIEEAQELMNKIKSVHASHQNIRHCKAYSQRKDETFYSEITKYNVEKELINRRLDGRLHSSANKKTENFGQNVKIRSLGTKADTQSPRLSKHVNSIATERSTENAKQLKRAPIMMPLSNYFNKNQSKSSGNKSNTTNLASINETISVIAEEDESFNITSVKVLNEEYDHYLRQWLQEIPIPATSPNKKTATDQVRLDFYNGMWKATTKLKFDPEVTNNPYYYQDMLDDEIDQLFEQLPQTNELIAKKQSLKNELIAKTIQMNEQIKVVAAPSCFKQQLIENLDNHLPKNTKLTQEEELKKDDIVEDYILFTKYKNDSDVKGNVHRSNFLKNVEVLADSIKKNHEKEYKGTDCQAYVNELITAVTKVPVPDTVAVQKAANETLIKKEIEHWFSDLPLKSNLSPQGKSCIINPIVNKVNEIEERLNINGSAAQSEMQKMLPKYLEKLNLKDDANIEFLIEELVNRLKNAAIEAKRRSETFEGPHNYDEFTKAMPACSSYHQSSGAIDMSSYMVRGGEVVKDPAPKYMTAKETTVPENQWLSMDQTKPPSVMLDWSQQSKRDTKPHGRTESHHISTSYVKSNETSKLVDMKANSYDKQTSVQSSRLSKNESKIPTVKQPNRQQMASGQMGILGTSQVGGPSGVRSLVKPNEKLSISPKPAMYHDKSGISAKINEKSINLSNTKPDIQHEFYLSTDSAGIRKIIEENEEHDNYVENGYLRMSDNSQEVKIHTVNAESMTSGRNLLPVDEYATRRNMVPEDEYAAGRNMVSEDEYAAGRNMLPEDEYAARRNMVPEDEYAAGRNMVLEDECAGRCLYFPAEDGFYPAAPPYIPGYSRCPNVRRDDESSVHLRFKYTNEKQKVYVTAIKSQTQPIIYNVDLDLLRSGSFSIKEYYDNRECNGVGDNTEAPHSSESKDSHLVIDNNNIHNEIKVNKISKEDTVIKQWGTKLQKLALKLNNPAEEERLKNKIDIYLQNSTEILTGSDDETIELKRRLPNNIIKIIKNSRTQDGNKEKPKYYSRCLIENLESVISNWLQMFHLSNAVVLNKTIDKEYIFHNIANTLEPLVLNRPTSDLKYLNYLRSNITNIVNDLPIAIDHEVKDYYLINLIDALVNEILHMDSKIPDSYIQPTIEEIRYFVKEQITFFLERLNITISRDMTEDLEKAITEHLLDLTNVEELNHGCTDEMANLFINITKMSVDNANYIAKIILNDYKEFFFRRHYFTDKSCNKFVRPDIIPGFKNSIEFSNFNELSGQELYVKQLIEKINKWCTELNPEIKDNDFKDIVIKNVAYDIVNRRNYLEKQVNHKGNVLKEFDSLKSQIFERTSQLVGEKNVTSKHIQKLIERLDLIPELQQVNYHEISKQNVENLSDLINKWFRNLPFDKYNLEDTYYKRQIENLAKDIEKRIADKEIESIGRDFDGLLLKTFKRKLSCTHIQQLKDDILSHITSREVNLKVDFAHEYIVEYYIDIIKKWIATVPLQSSKNKELSNTIQNGLAYELAVIIHKTKTGLNNSPTESLSNRLQEGIINWMNNRPLNQEIGDEILKATYIEQLANIIETCPIEKSNITYKETGEPLLVIKEKEHDSLNNNSEYEHLKLMKEKYYSEDSAISSSNEDADLQANIDTWVNKLPIHIVQTVCFENKKQKFVQKIKQLRISGAKDDVIINEIIHFMKTLPMDISHQDYKNVEEETDNLAQSLFVQDIYQEKATVNDVISKTVENVIKEWARFLKPLLEHNELTAILNETTALILKLFKIPKSKTNEDYDNEIRDNIVHTLKQLPLSEYISEESIFKMADYFAKTLKNILNTNAEKNEAYNKDTIPISYAQQMVYQITDWMNNFCPLNNVDERFKQTAIGDLVKDIMDRRKYLELNPQHRESASEKRKQLKIQIYLWIQKLLKFDYQKVNTMPYVEDLVKRIESIPVWKSKRQEYNICMQVGSSNYSSAHVQNDSVSEEIPNSKEAIFKKYQTFFKKKVYDLPIDSPTPESEQLAELARAGIYNNILKIFFSLKSDREFENDYGYFELILESKLDEMLDLLPQTEDLKRYRHRWKVAILENAVNMLKEIQDVTDRPSFRQKLKEGFGRKFARNLEIENCYLLQQGFLADMADDYILETKYKEEDPIKSNIYKQRLMKKIDEMANHLSKNIDFRFLKRSYLTRHAMKILHEVPIPSDEVLDEEIEQILLGQEIEQWYKELPIDPYLNDFDKLFRKRMMDILAAKLQAIDSQKNELDDSKDRLMQHEISKFLVERGRLQRGQGLNINYMVDELKDRLKNRKTNDLTEYNLFEKQKPASSTLAKVDNSELLVPLIDSSKTAEQLGGADQNYSKIGESAPFQWPAQPQDMRSVKDLSSGSHRANMKATNALPQIDEHLPSTSFAGRSSRNFTPGLRIRNSRIASINPNQSQSPPSFRANTHGASPPFKREYGNQSLTNQRSQNTPPGTFIPQYRPGESQRQTQTPQNAANFNEMNRLNQCTPNIRIGTNHFSREQSPDFVRGQGTQPFRHSLDDQIDIDGNFNEKCKCVERFKRRVSSYPCPCCVIVPPYRFFY